MLTKIALLIVLLFFKTSLTQSCYTGCKTQTSTTCTDPFDYSGVHAQINCRSTTSWICQPNITLANCLSCKNLNCQKLCSVAFIDQNKTCWPCSDKCKACNKTACTKCEKCYFLQNGVCLKTKSFQFVCEDWHIAIIVVPVFVSFFLLVGCICVYCRQKNSSPINNQLEQISLEALK